ncbi:MAG: TA system antitoxin ParD family protein [Nevskiaceae bacterium]
MRLDPELTRSAEPVASRMSRSVPEQIAHWARIGRELERSPEVSVAQVRKVLEGAAQYDALPAREQALVRAAWLERMQALGAALDLEREFAASGYRYAELDSRGAVTVHEPKPQLRKRAPRRAARR